MRGATWAISNRVWSSIRTLIIATAWVSLATGCRDSVPPTEAVLLPPTNPTAPPTPFPALARPGLVYLGNDFIYALFDFSHQGRLLSRYVLYEDETFALQFSSPGLGFFEYLGKYSRADSLITFDFEGWSSAGPWIAIGALSGDSLFVEYNEAMLWSDLMNGTYVRPPGAP